MFGVPSSVLVSRMSRKVSCLLCSLFLVKVMFFVVLFMAYRICSVLSILTMAKMLPTYLFHVLKFVVCDLLCFEMLHDDFCEEGG